MKKRKNTASTTCEAIAMTHSVNDTSNEYRESNTKQPADSTADHLTLAYDYLALTYKDVTLDSTDSYPTTKVILAFGFGGGAIGGGIIGMCMTLITANPTRVAISVLICALFGWFIGLIPAFITGIILAELKVKSDLALVMMVGFLVSFLYIIILCSFLFFINGSFNVGFLIFSLLIGAVGMCSSALIGYWVLPENS